jgi:prevent-host-death family protein
MKKWQIQEAQAKLCGVIQKTVNEEQQEISVIGKSTAVILSMKTIYTANT